LWVDGVVIDLVGVLKLTVLRAIERAPLIG